MQKRKAICAVTIFFLLGIALTAYAAKEGTYGTEKTSKMPMMGKGEMCEDRVGFLQRAGKVVGTEVKNQNNETIGTIRELLIDNNQKSVCYVIVAHENKLYPVPWSAFDTSGDTCTLNIARNNLMQAPSLDMIDLTTLSNIDYRQKAEKFYSEQISAVKEKGAIEEAADWMKEKMQQALGTGERPDLQRLSRIIGLEVQDSQGKELAEVEDILIDRRNGTVAYGLVSFGGLWGIGEKTAVVPYAALRAQPQMGIAKLDTDKTTLESAVLTKDQMQQLTQPQFARQVHQKFGAEPYWEVFGFVPGEEMKMSMDAWRPDSKYNRNFDTAKMTTIDGTIRSVGTFQPERGASPGLRLKVETSKGESVTVYAGPTQYAMQHDFNFKSGDAITVTGSKTRIGLKSVVMASEIQYGGKMLKLRDATGKPQWTVEEMQKQPKQQMKQQQKMEESGTSEDYMG